MSENLGQKAYLGDSVYAAFDEWGRVVLTTENGLSTDPSNIIVLEPEVCEALLRYISAAAPPEAKHGE